MIEVSKLFSKNEIIKKNKICKIYYMLYILAPTNKKKITIKFYKCEGIIVESYYNDFKSYILIEIKKQRNISIYRKFYIYSKNILRIEYI